MEAISRRADSSQRGARELLREGMANHRVTLRGFTFEFASLRELLGAASPLRSGDELAGVAARDSRHRAAAQAALADVALAEFLREPVVPYENDEVTRLILDTHNAEAFAPVRDLSVGQFRDWLLRYETTPDLLRALAPGLTPEMVAAVSKLMRNQDLVLAAGKCEVITRFRNTLGRRGDLAVRLQPNHPTDDPHGIAASITDGLLSGCGDACIGINPAMDSPARVGELLRLVRDVISEFEIPTQSCVLAHVTTQLAAMERGAPLDLLFQSIAGTEKANRSFGVDLALLREAHDAARAQHQGGAGPNVMYFETGQGSCLSADAHHGVDQQTLECRAYGVARTFAPLLVNTVVGFIGPEYLADGKQIIRAGLEDHFCGKLLGLPMGVDVCYTNHVAADHDDLDTLLTLLGAAGVNYIMGVPGGDDIMLGYQSTSFHDANYLRQVFGRGPAPEFAAWLQKWGIADPQHRLQVLDPGSRLLQNSPGSSSGLKSYGG